MICVDDPRARAFAVYSDGMRVDWQAVMLRLRTAGFTDAALSERLKIPRATLVDYRCKYAEPSWSNGQRIVALWCECTGSWPDALPIMSPYPQS